MRPIPERPRSDIPRPGRLMQGHAKYRDVKVNDGKTKEVKASDAKTRRLMPQKAKAAREQGKGRSR